MNFVAPQKSVASVYYNTSGEDTTNQSYFALEDTSTHQVILHEPLGSSGSVYEYPLTAGDTYGFVIQIGVGAINDGSLSGTANYSFNEELIISTVPEPSTFLFGGATSLTGMTVYCRRSRRV